MLLNKNENNHIKIYLIKPGT